MIDISSTFFFSGVRCSVGFIGGRTERFSQGSGTLIKFGNFKGILTCAHVLDEILREEEVGLLLFTVRPDEIQSMRLTRANLQEHTFFRGGPSWVEQGPDLAFIRLSPDIMANIESRASVINGDRQRAQFNSGEPERYAMASVVFGVVQEFTGATVKSGGLATTPFRGFLSKGNIVDVNEAHGLDLFRLQPVPDEADLPTSYEGTSGGGLWQLYLRADGSVIQLRLAGVAFYQKKIGDELHIIGHGPHSIYHTLYQNIKAKWPT